MSEPLAKERPSIDLDEFERRLRHHDTQSGHARHGDDPLAELARLVGEHHDPYGDVFAQEAVAHHQDQAHQLSFDASASHADYEPAGRREPAFGGALSSPLSGEFAAIEAGLRGALSAHPEAGAPMAAAEHEFYAQHEHYAEAPHYGQDEQAYLQDHEAQQWAAAPQPGVAHPAPSRARRPIYAMVATIAVGVIGIGVAFAYKGTSSSPRDIKTIMAASGPAKIQPPADVASDQGNQDPAILGKRSADAPTQLVNREEQPVDISQAVQENASRNADTGSGAPGDASNVPVPPSPSQAQGDADSMGGFGVGMPPPKRVKVVSVRPDGTILPNDAPPPAAMPAPRPVPSRASTSDDPIAKASSPKSTSRVTATPKPSKVAKDDDEAPAPKPSRKAKPQRVASLESAGDDTTASLGSKSGGGFAVQLAAPGSESDARSASSRFAKKYSSALSGHHIGFHKAQSNGKSVYRVRVGSLSKDDAVSLCAKLKADGGSCFVAKNN